MPAVTANGIQIAYDTFGNRSCPALLLIAGNGAQLLFWEAEFCELLAEKRFFVILAGDNYTSALTTTTLPHGRRGM